MYYSFCLLIYIYYTYFSSTVRCVIIVDNGMITLLGEYCMIERNIEYVWDIDYVQEEIRQVFIDFHEGKFNV